MHKGQFTAILYVRAVNQVYLCPIHFTREGDFRIPP